MDTYVYVRQERLRAHEASVATCALGKCGCVYVRLVCLTYEVTYGAVTSARLKVCKSGSYMYLNASMYSRHVHVNEGDASAEFTYTFSYKPTQTNVNA